MNCYVQLDDKFSFITKMNELDSNEITSASEEMLLEETSPEIAWMAELICIRGRSGPMSTIQNICRSQNAIVWFD